MTRLLRDGVSSEEAANIYEAWLLGERPAKGAAVSSGPVLCLTGSVPAAGDAEPFGEAAEVRTALDEARTKGALRNFRDWRRMPAGAAACSSSAGLLLFPADRWRVPEGAEELRFPGILERVFTEKEAAERFSVTAAAVKKACESGAAGREAKKTPAGWLMAESAAARLFAGEERAEDILPLLLVFAAPEAGHLWNRSGDEVRSAAAGAGHRAARLGEGERRRAGRTWLVTRAAMEKLYGDPVPERWRAFAEAMRKK